MHHVVLLLPGQNFQKLNHLPIFWHFWRIFFQTEESRPDYICIDKACLVLRTALRNGSWNRIWEKTTQSIVDAYHYINHRDDDELCKKWCNPAPADGSAPNLVVEAKDKKGKTCFRHAFNTQVRFDNCFIYQ